MSLRPPEIVLSELERTELERLVRTHTAAQQLVTRAWIILAAGDGQNNAQIARWLGLDDETPGYRRIDLAAPCRAVAQKKPISSHI